MTLSIGCLAKPELRQRLSAFGDGSGRERDTVGGRLQRLRDDLGDVSHRLDLQRSKHVGRLPSGAPWNSVALRPDSSRTITTNPNTVVTIRTGVASADTWVAFTSSRI
jgi:hypothetical protein